jgi:hypothetical protein
VTTSPPPVTTSPPPANLPERIALHDTG